jgi:hypothetical protein
VQVLLNLATKKEGYSIDFSFIWCAILKCNKNIGGEHVRKLLYRTKKTESKGDRRTYRMREESFKDASVPAKYLKGNKLWI